MVGVLLVDDVPGERANFEQAFGRDLTVAPSIDQLNEQLRRGLIWDLAFVVFSWVPLHARDVVVPEGFTDFASRPRRLRMPLDAYGYTGSVSQVLDAVTARVTAHMQDVRDLANAGNPLFARLIDSGVLNALNRRCSSSRPTAPGMITAGPSECPGSSRVALWRPDLIGIGMWASQAPRSAGFLGSVSCVTSFVKSSSLRSWAR